MTNLAARSDEQSSRSEGYLLRWLKSFLLSVFSGWATAIFLMPLTSLSGSERYLFPFDGRLNEDVTVALMTLVIFLIPASLLLILVATILRLLRSDLPWVYVLVGLLTPVCLMLIFPPDADEIIFVGSGGCIATLGIWVLLRGPIFPAIRAPAVATGQILAALMVTACIGFLISSHVILARENDANKSVRASTTSGRVMGGLATGDELLAYNWAGALVSYRLTDWQSKIVAPSSVVSVVHDPSGIWTMSLPPLPNDQQYDDPLQTGQFTVSRYEAGKLLPISSGRYEVNDRPVAFLIRNNVPVVIGRKSIHQFNADRNAWNPTSLQPAMEKLPGDIIASVASPNDSSRFAYLAFNIGEFGGGILKIDLQTGNLQRIERRDSNELCVGPLNADCDPVTGIVPDPEQDECVLASIGLRHMLEHGRIVRVCDSRVEVVSEITSSGASMGRKVRRFFGQKPKSPPPFSEAFFGLVSDKIGKVWASSARAVYRYDGKRFRPQEMPDLQRHGDLLATTKVPGVIILSTDMNARNSLSGSTPLIIPVN